MNEKGSVTLFLIIVMMGIVGAFTLFFNDLVQAQCENTALNSIRNASRNIEASYNQTLYTDYGLLAYDEETLTGELELSMSQRQKSFYKLAFQNLYTYRTDYTVDLTLENVSETAKQMIAQAGYNAPVKMLENAEAYQGMVEKLKHARDKVRSIEGLNAGLERIHTLNENLGEGLDALKNLSEACSVRVSSRGNISVKDKALVSLQENILETIAGVDRERTAYLQAVDAARRDVEAHYDTYPAEFAESLLKQFSEADGKTGEVFTLAPNISGYSVSSTYEGRALEEIEHLNLSAEMEEEAKDLYRTTLGGLMEIEDALEEFEEDMTERYENELDALEALDSRERRQVRRDIQEKIERRLENDLGDVRVGCDEINMNLGNTDLATSAKSVMAHHLSDEDTPLSFDEIQELSSEVISPQTAKLLPSSRIEETGAEYAFYERAALAEYIMGTFRHRNSQQYGDAWDFYGKLERKAYFEDGEVEYIIAGNRSEKMNRILVAGEIYVVREASNIVHVYTCKEKRDYAVEVAGYFPGPPYLKPLVFNGLLIGWASIESGVDLNRLLTNETVPLMKISDDDWYTDIGLKKKSDDETALPADEDKSEKDLVVQDYAFYLRVLLNGDLLVGEETMTLRALDLIALNMGTESNPAPLDTYVTGHTLRVLWGGKDDTYSSAY